MPTNYVHVRRWLFVFSGVFVFITEDLGCSGVCPWYHLKRTLQTTLEGLIYTFFFEAVYRYVYQGLELWGISKNKKNWGGTEEGKTPWTEPWAGL